MTPHLRITFLDGDEETIIVALKHTDNAFTRAGLMWPGFQADPSQEQMETIGRGYGGYEAAQYFLERLACERYEGNEKSGTFMNTLDDLLEVPDMCFRNLTWEYVNDPYPA